MRLLTQIAIVVFALSAWVWTESSGVTGIFVSSTRGTVVQSELARRRVRDPEHGVIEREILEVKIAYAVKGQQYFISRQWNDEFWISNGRLDELAQELAMGNPIDVLFVRFAPGVARPDVQVPLGVVLLVVIGVPIPVVLGAGAALRRRKVT